MTLDKAKEAVQKIELEMSEVRESMNACLLYTSPSPRD